MGVARAFPALCHTRGPWAGYPLSYGVYKLALREMERAEARSRLRLAEGVRLGMAMEGSARDRWTERLEEAAKL